MGVVLGTARSAIQNVTGGGEYAYAAKRVICRVAAAGAHRQGKRSGRREIVRCRVQDAQNNKRNGRTVAEQWQHTAQESTVLVAINQMKAGARSLAQVIGEAVGSGALGRSQARGPAWRIDSSTPEPSRPAHTTDSSREQQEILYSISTQAVNVIRTMPRQTLVLMPLKPAC